ncbi:Cytochrome b5-related protein [Blattella germanica]|nr:Cytochrome b5-related protein [Blattella germanica]
MFALEEEKKSSLPGLKYPSLRDSLVKSADIWLDGKRQDDNVGDLWRVHDELYDLTEWIEKHPGGSDWINFTRGTDITEAFEAHHISLKAELMLKNFHVGPANGPRNSPYTFKEDGFYRTLKQKVRRVLSESPPGVPWKSMVIADSLLAGTFITGILSAITTNFLLGIVSGTLLALTVISAHNFFHQKDNLRMYYFDLSFMSSRSWRVSHSMSHHLYTNTVLDMEISMLEPFLQYLPRKSKPWWIRYGSWISSPAVYAFVFHSFIGTRMYMALKGYKGALKKEDLLPLLLPLLMLLCSGYENWWAIIMWTWIVIVSSFVFGFIGVSAAHHHPDIFHDGDTPREDRDWGIGQIDAVRDRPEITGSLFLTLVTFGDHCLHHLFPTVDHSHLHLLSSVFEETCKEFNIEEQKNSFFGLVIGQFRQLANNTPNPDPPGKKILVVEK